MRFAPKHLLTLAILAAPAATARADGDPGSLQVLFAATGAKTDHQSDAAAMSALKVGYNANEWLGFHFFNRFGYGARNQRLLTFISLGTQLTLDLGTVNPYFRLAVAHQHEERASVFKDHVLGSLLGFSPGIHHRGGAETAIGLEMPLTPIGDLQAFAAIEASSIYFLDSNGPRLYVGGTAGLGINYSLE